MRRLIQQIDKDTLDIGTRNPNKVNVVDERTPKEIISEIEKLDNDSFKLLKKIKELV